MIRPEIMGEEEETTEAMVRGGNMEEVGVQGCRLTTTAPNMATPMQWPMDRLITIHLQETKATQAIGIRRHKEARLNLMAFSTTDQTIRISLAITDPHHETGRSSTGILRHLRLVARSLQERDHTQQLSPSPQQPDQGHKLLQPFRALTLAYHSLCHRNLQNLHLSRSRSLESTISLG